MKNRCQVFEKSIGLYIIVLIMLFYSCSEDKGNYDYKAVNEVIVTGVTKDTSVMRGDEHTSGDRPFIAGFGGGIGI